MVTMRLIIRYWTYGFMVRGVDMLEPTPLIIRAKLPPPQEAFI